MADHGALIGADRNWRSFQTGWVGGSLGGGNFRWRFLVGLQLPLWIILFGLANAAILKNNRHSEDLVKSGGYLWSEELPSMRGVFARISCLCPDCIAQGG